LNGSSAWSSRFIRARHGVIFPDCEKPDDDLGADIPLHICCFLDEFENELWDWVMSRLWEVDDSSHRERSLGQDGMKALEELLAHPFQLHVPIGNILAEDDNSINLLTEQQFQILETIQDIQRAVISGGAGTGKTLLAMEEALRCAKSDENILVTCYNKPLAEEINSRLGDEDNITVATFHEVCFRFGNEAGIEIPDEENKDYLFNEIYPEIFSHAMEKLPDKRFDVIIIDEGQDFLPGWISVLNKALRSDSSSKLRLFVDNNQSVYGNLNIIPSDVKPIPIRLIHNMRNTKRIHSVVLDYYEGHPISSTGPEGVDVEWIPADSPAKIHDIIYEKLNLLIENERVEPGDIAVLGTNKKNIDECFFSGRKIKYNTSLATEREDSSVIVDTIRRFKGLESRVVILIATPDLIKERELIYVALSRARTDLIVIGTITELKQSAKQK
jgi:superfamily I DNA and RNA helicase